MKRTSLNLDEDIYERFKIVAAAKRHSVSQYLNLMMEQAIKDFEKRMGKKLNVFARGKSIKA
ncbi:MAG: hypothetical protein V1746_06170 [bacterium]